MKKLSRALAVLMVATLSLSSVSASASEVTEVTRAHEHPAFSENAEEFKANFKFGMMRSGGDREKIEMTDEEKASTMENLKAGDGKKVPAGMPFKRMQGERSAKPSFDGERFQNLKDKLADMTEEEKAEMLVNLRTAEGGKPFAAKFAGFPKAGVRMMGKPSAETENEA